MVVVVRRYIDILIIGASLSEPHTYRTAVQDPPYIHVYTCIYIRAVRPSVSMVIWSPRRTPLNAQRANVGPASKGSKVDNIALKNSYFSFTL